LNCTGVGSANLAQAWLVRFQSELAIHLVKPIFLTLRNLLTAPAKKNASFETHFI
jgi:hypothetical protein